MRSGTPSGSWRAEWLEGYSDAMVVRYEVARTPREIKAIVCERALRALNAEVAISYRGRRVHATLQTITAWDPSSRALPNIHPDSMCRRREVSLAGKLEFQAGVRRVFRTAVRIGLIKSHEAADFVEAADELVATVSITLARG